MKRLKIVHILPLIKPGGAENLVFGLAKIQNQDHDVTIISLLPKTECSVDNLNVIYLNKKVGFDLGAMIRLYKTLAAISPDIVHTHLYSAFYAFPWFLLSTKRVGIHTVHSTVNKEFGKIHRLLQRIAYTYLNVTPTAISDTIKLQLVEEYKISPDNIPVIYNAIDTKQFSCPNRGFDNEIITIVNVAALSPWKNQQLLIEAFHAIHIINENLRLIFVGDGECREALVALTNKYSLQDKILFVGMTHEVWAWLNKGDIFVLCSLYEGLPLSILEALSAGLPVIATDVGGIRDVVKDGVNGIIVKNNNQDELANAILLLAKDPDLRSRISKTNTLESQKYDILLAQREYLDLYFKEIGENRDCRK